MNIKIINTFCFLLPFVGSVFNLQNLVRIYYPSEALIQGIAYGSLLLLILGMAINIRNSTGFSNTAKLWIAFFIFYYSFGILASALHDNPANILASIVPVIYMLGFYVYLSSDHNRKLFGRVTLVSLIAISAIGIYLFSINWHLSKGGTSLYNVDRSGGVYGDANSNALISIISFIFVYKKYKPVKQIFKYFKLFLLSLIFYSLAITFSNTGYLAFVICFMLLNHKFFNLKRILFLIVLVPLFYFTLLNLNELVSGFDLTTPQRDKVSNIVNLLTFNVDQVDKSGRDDLVVNLLYYINKSPIVGNGIDFAISIHGHNTLLGVWVDAGIITFFIFLFMLGNYFKNAVKSAPDIRYFVLPILFVMCVFMLSLQSIINQGYLVALFIYIGYLVDNNTPSSLNEI